MIRLQLDEEETTILQEMLESCLADLHDEITRTENLEYKTMLKGKKAVLLKLQESLKEAIQS